MNKAVQAVEEAKKAVLEASSQIDKALAAMSQKADKANQSVKDLSTTLGASFVSGLQRGTATTEDFRNQLIEIVNKLGLSAKQIEEVAKASRLFTEEELAAASASEQTNQKIEKLSGAFTKGKTSTQQFGAEFGNLARSSQGAAQKLANFSRIVETAKMAYSQFTAALAVAQQVYQVVKQAIDATAGEFVDFADAVRTLTQINGQSAESNSNLIQTLSAYKVTTDEIITGQRTLAAQGKSLTIPTLVELADQYAKLNSDAERQAFLTKNLGSTSTAWMNALSQGSVAIKSQASANRDLLLTQEDLNNAREYELKLAELDARKKALQIEAGKGVVETELEVLDAIEKQNEADERRTQNQMKSLPAGTMSPAMAERMREEAKKAEEREAAHTKSLWEAYAAYRALSDGVQNAAGSVDMFGMSVGTASDLAQQDALAMQQLQNEFNFVLNYAQSYRNNQKNIKTATDDLSQAEQELHDLQKAGWGESSQKVIEAKGKVEEMRGRLDEVKQAGREATLEMIAGFMQTQLTLDGNFDQADMRKILEYRKQVGLLTDEEFNEAIGAMEEAQTVLAGFPPRITTEWEFIVTTTSSFAPSGVPSPLKQQWIAYHAAQAQYPNDPSKWPPQPSEPEPAFATGTNYVSGLFVAGESGGGAEYIYAPGGATVFNPKQTRAMQSEMARMRPTEQHNYLYGPATLVITNEESVESLLSVR